MGKEKVESILQGKLGSSSGNCLHILIPGTTIYSSLVKIVFAACLGLQNWDKLLSTGRLQHLAGGLHST